MQKLSFFLAFVLLISGQVPPAAAQGNATVAIVEVPSPLLKSAPNFRDIGGYRTLDGHEVKRGLVYRSDQLDRLSDADLEAMKTLRIRLVIDLRTASERAHEPDRIPASSRLGYAIPAW